jgi:hypothetical protein
MSLTWKAATAGIPVLPGEFTDLDGSPFFEPNDGFDIGTAGQLDYGIQPPDAIHIKSGSIM